MTINTGNNTSPQINVTPLIDVLLVLLVIFMMIAPSHPRGLDAMVPQPPATDKQVSAANPVVISMQDLNGAMQLSINQLPVSAQDLKARLTEILKLRADRTAFLSADGSLDFNVVAQVVDTMHAAGVERLGLMTATATAR